MKQILIYILVLFSIHCYGQQQMFLQATAAGGGSVLDPYPGAAFAGAIDVLLYSSHSELDNIAGSQTNGVTDAWTVTIRRSVDNALRSFTADEVSDGTMLAWIGTGTGQFGTIRRFWDQSGNGNHSNQTNDGLQPAVSFETTQYSDNGRFSTYMTTEAQFRHLIIPDLNTTDLTNFAVFNIDVKSNDSATFVYTQWQNGNTVRQKWITSMNNITEEIATTGAVSYAVSEEFYVNNAISIGVPFFQQQILFSQRISGMTAADDVVTLIGGLANSNGTSTATLGGTAFGGFTGHFQCLVMFPSNQSANMSAISNAINTEYSIYP